VPQVPKTLQWQTFSGAQLYKVVVMEVVIRRSGLRKRRRRRRNPRILRAKMFPGKPILWQVTALGWTRPCLGTLRFSGFLLSRAVIQRPSRHNS